MPNRMLRDYTASEKINGISFQAEVFFIRLMMKADDYGCFHGHPSLLKANLYPLKLESVREADISRWAAECQKAGLIVKYEHQEKQYVQIVDFRQRLDKARHKFPLPSSTEFPEVVNEFPAERERENERELEQKKKPLSSVFDREAIPVEAELQKAYEFVYRLGNNKATLDWVKSMWAPFLIHSEKEEYLNDKGKQIFHFRNWLKTQKVEKQEEKPAERSDNHKYLKL